MAVGVVDHGCAIHVAVYSHRRLGRDIVTRESFRGCDLLIWGTVVTRLGRVHQASLHTVLQTTEELLRSILSQRMSAVVCAQMEKKKAVRKYQKRGAPSFRWGSKCFGFVLRGSCDDIHLLGL